MELPFELKSAIERASEGAPRARLMSASAALSRKYIGETGAGKRLATTADEALAYAIARMPATYAAARAALREISRFGARTLLDVGAGTGAATWAAFDALESLESAVCLEREPEMLKLAKALARDCVQAEWRDIDARQYAFTDKYDIVVAAYCLGEMSDGDRLALALKMWRAADKALVIIEPGTPVGARQIRDIRAELVAKGARVVAPCAHSNACPLDADDWCHFACRVARSRAHKALKGGDAPYEDEKFAYIALTRESAENHARVLRHPLVQTGKVTLKLCAADGVHERAFTKKDGDMYKIARKLRWGDALDM